MPLNRRLASTRILFLCLLLPLVGSVSAQSVLLLGDSLTRGFPNGDAVDYQGSLPGGVTYIGNETSDSGALYVGGNGHYISRAPKAGGPIVAGVFNSPGVLEKLAGFTPDPDPSPDYVVVLAGVNDLMRLILPADSNDSFEPDSATPNDYTAGGTYYDGDSSGNPPNEHDVDPLIDRYESLLDTVAARYPGTAEIICLALPPIDQPNHDFAAIDPPSDPPHEQLLADAVDDFNDQIDDLVMDKGIVSLSLMQG